MQQFQCFSTLAASAAVAATCVAMVFLSSELAFAAEASKPGPRDQTGSCTCPGQGASPWARPRYADFKLDERDEIAALESVQYALSEVGDGSSYVWHRHHGKLSGLVQPTSSFKAADGSVCRHVVLVLSSATRSRKAEGVACRGQNGLWRLEG